MFQYNIEKPATEDDDDEDDDDDYTFGPKKTEEKEDAIASKLLLTLFKFYKCLVSLMFLLDLQSSLFHYLNGKCFMIPFIVF